MQRSGGANKAICPHCQRRIPGPRANKRMWGGSVIRDGQEVLCPHCGTLLTVTDVHTVTVPVLQYMLQRLTPAQEYVQQGARSCPFCAVTHTSDSVSPVCGDVQYCTDEAPPRLKIKRSCSAGHTWTDVYTLEGFDES